MGVILCIVLLLSTFTLGELSDEKRLLVSDQTQFQNEIQQLKSMVSNIQTTLSSKIATMESDLKLARSALSVANSRQAALELRLNSSESALVTAKSKLASYSIAIADLKSTGKSVSYGLSIWYSSQTLTSLFGFYIKKDWLCFKTNYKNVSVLLYKIWAQQWINSKITYRNQDSKI